MYTYKGYCVKKLFGINFASTKFIPLSIILALVYSFLVQFAKMQKKLACQQPIIIVIETLIFFNIKCRSSHVSKTRCGHRLQCYSMGMLMGT